jgi:predicted component of type VI protein secretion system
MDKAALGVRMHSGWGALVAIGGAPLDFEVLARRRLIVAADTHAAKFPYHHAQEIGLAAGETYLAHCRTEGLRLARAALRPWLAALAAHHEIVGVALLEPAARATRPLAEILAAHPLIHSAEGEFFRGIVREVCSSLGLSVAGRVERQLESDVGALFLGEASALTQRVDAMGRSIGAPWTLDQKQASLAALTLLAPSASATQRRGARHLAHHR